MPNPNGNPNLHGVKGKSGRKSLRVEFAKTQAIKKAWNKVEQEIESKDVEKVALPIALRDMAIKNELSGEVKITPIYGAKSISKHESDREDIQPEKEDKSNIGGDIGK